MEGLGVPAIGRRNLNNERNYEARLLIPPGYIERPLRGRMYDITLPADRTEFTQSLSTRVLRSTVPWWNLLSEEAYTPFGQDLAFNMENEARSTESARILSEIASRAAAYITNADNFDVSVIIAMAPRQDHTAKVFYTGSRSIRRNPSDRTEHSREEARELLRRELYNEMIAYLLEYNLEPDEGLLRPDGGGWELPVSYIRVRVRAPRTPRGIGYGSTVCTSFAQARNNWILFEPGKTDLNCLYYCLDLQRSLSRGGKRLRDLNPRELFDMTLPATKTKLTRNASKLRTSLRERVLEAGQEFNELGGSFETLQQFADLYQTNVKVYSRAYIEIFSCSPREDSALAKSMKRRHRTSTVELRLDNRHYCGLIRKNEIMKLFGSLEFIEKIESISRKNEHLNIYVPPENVSTKIPELPPADEEFNIISPVVVNLNKYSNSDIQAKKIFVFDLETYIDEKTDFHQVYAAGLGWFDDELQPVHRLFWGKDAVHQMLDYMAENIDHQRLDNSYLCAHNFGTFDCAPLISTLTSRSSTLPWKLCASKMLESSGGWIDGAMKMEGDRQTNQQRKVKYITVKFRDSYRLLPQSLAKLCVDFAVPDALKKDCFPHDRVRHEDYHVYEPFIPGESPLPWTRMIEDNWEESEHGHTGAKEYLRRDVVSLLWVLKAYNEVTFQEFNISCVSVPTAASLSKKIFLSKYYSKDVPIATANNDVENVLRGGFFGGRCESWYSGVVNKKLYYYDFTSVSA